MLAEQFDVIARLIRARGGAAQDAAGLVLVNGLKGVDAAKKAGCSAQSVCEAVKRFKEAESLIKSVEWEAGTG